LPARDFNALRSLAAQSVTDLRFLLARGIKSPPFVCQTGSIVRKVRALSFSSAVSNFAVSIVPAYCPSPRFRPAHGGVGSRTRQTVTPP
jgi:hypothetical protein